MGVSEQYHLPANALNSTDRLSGMMNLKSHYNLASGRDTIIKAPPHIVFQTYNYVNSYYYSSTDRATWIPFEGTSIVPLFNDPYSQTLSGLKRGDVIIVIMFSAKGSLHVAGTSSVATRNRVNTYTSFSPTIASATGTSLSAWWLRIPNSATNQQLLTEYTYLSRGDVLANATMGSSTSASNVTEGQFYVLRDVPTTSTPFLNTSITGAWQNADNNEIAQRIVLQNFGKYNTLYLNYVYTPIDLSSAVPDAYPDAIGYIVSNDFTDWRNFYTSFGYSDNSLWEVFSRSWISDNIPKMYSTSPIYNNRKLTHNFVNATFPAITGFFDVTGSILIEIPY
jgi:hypothetical protein